MLSAKNLHFISYSAFSWLQLATTGPCHAYVYVIKRTEPLHTHCLYRQLWSMTKTPLNLMLISKLK